jgi:hypothetical protein
MFSKMVFIIGAVGLAACGKDSYEKGRDNQDDTVLIDIKLDPAATIPRPTHGEYQYPQQDRGDVCYQNGSRPCMPKNVEKPSNADACQWNGYSKGYVCHKSVTSCLIRSIHQRDTLYPNGIRVSIQNMKRCIATIGY